jgi:ATP-dependent helicase Lhr and Lhr-like helicase
MKLSGINAGVEWFNGQGWTPFPFQLETWHAYLDGYSGLLNAPTGSGKTYALALPVLLHANTQVKQKVSKRFGLPPFGH